MRIGDRSTTGFYLVPETIRSVPVKGSVKKCSDPEYIQAPEC